MRLLRACSVHAHRLQTSWMFCLIFPLFRETPELLWVELWRWSSADASQLPGTPASRQCISNAHTRGHCQARKHFGFLRAAAGVGAGCGVENDGDGGQQQAALGSPQATGGHCGSAVSRGLPAASLPAAAGSGPSGAGACPPLASPAGDAWVPGPGAAAPWPARRGVRKAGWPVPAPSGRAEGTALGAGDELGARGCGQRYRSSACEARPGTPSAGARRGGGGKQRARPRAAVPVALPAAVRCRGCGGAGLCRSSRITCRR